MSSTGSTNISPESSNEDRQVTFVPGGNVQMMWYYEVLLSRRRFERLLIEPNLDPSIFVFYTRQHLMMIFNEELRDGLLAALDRELQKLDQNTDLFLKKRYVIIRIYQEFISKVATFCDRVNPHITAEEEGYSLVPPSPTPLLHVEVKK